MVCERLGNIRKRREEAVVFKEGSSAEGLGGGLEVCSRDYSKACAVVL